jgi:prophage regulatory protein
MKATHARRESGLERLPLAEPPLLRIIDVCRWLRISKPTFWRLRREADFPAPIEITDRVIGWPKSEIQSWLEARRRSRRRPE